MAEYIRQLVKTNPELSLLERNLFATAFRQVVAPKRTAYRVLSAEYGSEQGKQAPANRLAVIAGMRRKVRERFVVTRTFRILICAISLFFVLPSSLFLSVAFFIVPLFTHGGVRRIGGARGSHTCR